VARTRSALEQGGENAAKLRRLRKVEEKGRFERVGGSKKPERGGGGQEGSQREKKPKSRLRHKKKDWPRKNDFQERTGLKWGCKDGRINLPKNCHEQTTKDIPPGSNRPPGTSEVTAKPSGDAKKSLKNPKNKKWSAQEPSHKRGPGNINREGKIKTVVIREDSHLERKRVNQD